MARLGNGDSLRLELELAPTSFEGEPAVQLSVPAAGRDAAEVAHTLTSVLDSDPTKQDPRTHHQALPVVTGVKFAANAWIHLYDYKMPNLWGCTGAFG